MIRIPPEGPATSPLPTPESGELGRKRPQISRVAIVVRVDVLLRAALCFAMTGWAAGCQPGSAPSSPSGGDGRAYQAGNEPQPSAEELATIREDMASLRVRKNVSGSGPNTAAQKSPVGSAASNTPPGPRPSDGVGAASTDGAPKATNNVAVSSSGTAGSTNGTGANEVSSSTKASASSAGLSFVSRGAELVAGGVPVIPAAREVKLLIPEKTFRQEGRDRSWRVSFDDIDLLKVLNMDPVTPDAVEKMPSWLRSLDGRRVRIRGFMYPPNFEDGIRQFLLARDNQICCFGRNPKLYDIIEVSLKEDSTTRYIENRPFDVIGTLRIQAVGDAVEIGGLYYLDNAEVVEK